MTTFLKRKDNSSIYGTISHSWVLCMKIFFLSHCCFQNWLLSTIPQLNFIHFGRKFLMPAFDRNLPFKSNGTAEEIVTMGLFCPNLSTSLSTEKRQDLNFHLVNHYSPKVAKLRTVCTVCLEELPSFYSPTTQENV